MVKHSMDLLELLRKRGIDGDVDFLREALRVLVDGIMDAEVSAQIGPARRTQPRAGHLPQPHLGYPRRHHGVAHSQAAGRQLLPQPAGTTAAQREGSAVGDPAGLRGGSLHPKGGRPDQGPGLRWHLQQPGVAHLRATGRSGGEFPGSSPGRRSLPLRVAGRPDAEGSGGRSHRQRLRGGGDGGQCRRAA